MSNQYLLVDVLESRRLMSSVPPPLYGDADCSAKVDLADFNVLAANFNRGLNATWVNGDFNADGGVDVTDFTLLATHFNSTAPVFSGVRITAPGTYGGYYAGGVEVVTSGLVKFDHAIIGGTMHVRGGPDLHVNNCVFHDQGTGLAVEATLVHSADVSNNTVVGGAGFEFSGWNGDQYGITVNYNTMTDVTGPYEHGRLVVFANLPNLPRSSIVGNQVTNRLGKTNSEDIVSLWRSGGTYATPLMIWQNWIDGSYWTNSPTSQFSGSGIILGDGGGGVGYVDVALNTVFDTSNVGITINGGHDTRVHLNRVFAQAGSGLGNVGLAGWNASGDSSWANNVIEFNAVRWQKAGGGINDVWSPDAFEQDNVSPDVTSVDAAFKAAEYQSWLNQLHGHKLGA